MDEYAQILEEVCPLYELKVENCAFISHSINRIYSVQKNNERLFLRITFSSHRTLQMLQEECEYLAFLSENSLGVAVPIKNKNQQWVSVLRAPKPKNTQNEIVMALLFPEASGVAMNVDHDLKPEIYLKQGKYTGEIHYLTQLYHQKNSRKIEREHWNHSRFLSSDAQELLVGKEACLIEPLKKLIQKIDQIPKTPANFGLIHSDLHLYNCYIKGSQLFYYDFDNTEFGYYLMDVSSIIAHFWANTPHENKWYKDLDTFLKYFLTGYQMKNRIDLEEWKHLEDLLLLRDFYNYIYNLKMIALGNITEFSANSLSQDEWRSCLLQEKPLIQFPFADVIASFLKINAVNFSAKSYQ